jgi:hypothetical protein
MCHISSAYIAYGVIYEAKSQAWSQVKRGGRRRSYGHGVSRFCDLRLASRKQHSSQVRASSVQTAPSSQLAAPCARLPLPARCKVTCQLVGFAYAYVRI